jgi:hypothetical protein
LPNGLTDSARAAVHAESALSDSAEQLRVKFDLSRSTAEIVQDIKKTMRVVVPPHGFTVIETLCEHERDKVFNQRAADTFPEIHQKFGNAIRDFVLGRDGPTPTRSTRKIAENAWKQDYAADRRALDPARSNDFNSPYRGRPEKYDPTIVWAFADAIASAAERKQFSIGHHGDVMLAHDNTAGGPMLRTLVAAVQWAMSMAWQASSLPGTEAPIVKPEGILSVIKRGR